MKGSMAMLASLMLTSLLAAGPAYAQVPEPRERQEPVIEPALERPEVVIPRIDTENFEINAFVGLLSIEDFGTQPVYGLRAAYHLSENFFLEASFGLSSIQDSSYRRLGIPLFESETEDVAYYNLSLAYNIFPGEIFVGRGRAYTSAIFLVIGAGNIRIVDEDEFTYSVGLGLRVLPRDWLSLRVDLRNHMFDSDLLGQSKLTHNPELSLGLGFYF